MYTHIYFPLGLSHFPFHSSGCCVILLLIFPILSSAEIFASSETRGFFVALSSLIKSERPIFFYKEWVGTHAFKPPCTRFLSFVGLFSACISYRGSSPFNSLSMTSCACRFASSEVRGFLIVLGPRKSVSLYDICQWLNGKRNYALYPRRALTRSSGEIPTGSRSSNGADIVGK